MNDLKHTQKQRKLGTDKGKEAWDIGEEPNLPASLEMKGNE